VRWRALHTLTLALLLPTMARAQTAPPACERALTYGDTVTLGVGVRSFVGKNEGYAPTLSELFAQDLQLAVSLPASAVSLMTPFTYAGSIDTLMEYGGAFGGMEITVGTDSVVRSIRWLQSPPDSATADSILAGVNATMQSIDGKQIARAVAGTTDVQIWLEFSLVRPVDHWPTFAHMTAGMQRLDQAPARGRAAHTVLSGKNGAGEQTTFLDARGKPTKVIVVSHHLPAANFIASQMGSQFRPGMVGLCPAASRLLIDVVVIRHQ
jgi:hypothetical protein